MPCLKDTWNSVITCGGKELVAYVVGFLQEYMAVVFQLVCMSRLGATPIVSTLVLFLTLVVFTGPLLNAWLMVADHICVLHSPPEKILVMIAFMGAHAAGAVSAGGIVAAFSKEEAKSAKSMLFWKTPEKVAELKDLGLDDWQLVNHFFDELFGVTSLLMGCVYLLWLEQLKNEKHEQSTKTFSDVPRIKIRFYLHLTLLVAAVSQAFPSAHLSPHISIYLLFTEQIHVHVFACRFGAGFVACFLTWVWSCFRTSYYNEIQKEPKETKYALYTQFHSDDKYKADVLEPKARMPSIRLSMHGGSYI